MKFSIILPAYNEEDHIGESIEQVSRYLDSLELDYEIIIVDDGSKDETKRQASKYVLDGKIRIFGYDQNMGKGYAIRYGCMHSLGDYVFFMDSDLDIDTLNLAAYLRSIKDADLVIASKRHPRSNVDEPLIRRVLSLGLYFLIRLMTGVQVSDTQTGLKGFRSESLKKILPLLSVKKYAFDIEVLVVAQLLRMKIVELPVKVHLDASFGVRHIVQMALDLLGITYRLRVKHWYQNNLNNQATKTFLS